MCVIHSLVFIPFGTLYRQYGYPTAGYESGGTRWFKYGRTDAIRSTTNAAHAFVKAMTDPDALVGLAFMNNITYTLTFFVLYTNVRVYV